MKKLGSIKDDKEQVGKKEQTRVRILTQSQEPSSLFSPISSSTQEVNGAPREHSLFPSSSPIFFLHCLLFQVMKTEWLTETFSCCFHDLDNVPEPPATLVQARGEV